MSETDYDVVIVGASIAGCTAATFLARQGAHVALVESHSDPDSYKVMCTHVFQSSASPTVRRLGIRDDLLDAGAREAGVNIWSRFGWISPDHASYMQKIEEEGRGLNLRRKVLDPMLRQMAADTDGVDLMMGHTATALLRDGKRFNGIAVRSDKGEERDLRAKLVVGADGRKSGVAKMAGLKTKVRANNRFVYMAYYRDMPVVTGSSPMLWFLDPDMAYAFPTDDDLTMLACVPHKDRIPEFKADPEGAIARVFEGLPEGPRLDPDKRVGKVLGKLDAANERRPPASNGLALVGDAALAADPLWGVGCGWAFQTGEWLAEEVGPALGNEEGLDRALKRYARRHRKSLAAHDRVCSAYSDGRKFNPIERAFFRAAARDQELAGRFALFGERWIQPRELLTPGTIGLMVKANVSRKARPQSLQTSPAS